MKNYYLRNWAVILLMKTNHQWCTMHRSTSLLEKPRKAWESNILWVRPRNLSWERALSTGHLQQLYSELVAECRILRRFYLKYPTSNYRALLPCRGQEFCRIPRVFSRYWSTSTLTFALELDCELKHHKGRDWFTKEHTWLLSHRIS